MKWQLLLFILLAPMIALAQDEIPLPKDSLVFVYDSSTVNLKFLRKYTIQKNFTKGDLLLFSFKEAEGKGISKIKIIAEATEFVDTILKKPLEITKMPVEIHETGLYTFRFYNRKFIWPKKRPSMIAIWKVLKTAPIIPLEDFVTFDTTWQHYTDSLITRDTFWLPLMDETVAISPIRDLHAISRSVVELTIPPEVHRWFYWLGVGPEAAKHYTQWAEAITKWPSPLHGYAQGGLSELPINGSGNRINYYFTINDGHKRFLNTGQVSGVLSSGIGIRAAYNQVSKSSLEEQKSYLCLENSEQVSNINAQIKVLGMSVKPLVTFFLDSLVGPIQPSIIPLDTTGMSLDNIKEIFALYERSLLAARESEKGYPASLDSIARQLDTIKWTYLDPDRLKVDQNKKDGPILSYNIDTLLQEIKEVDSLKIDPLVVDLKKQQAFLDSLAIINQDIQIIGIQVDSLVRWHGIRENTPEEVHQFTNMMMDVLDQIIRLTPAIEKSLVSDISMDSTVVKQSTRLPILADSIGLISDRLGSMTTSNKNTLDAIETEIERMENTLVSLTKGEESELIKDPIPDGRNQETGEINRLLKIYQNIDVNAKALRSKIEACLVNDQCKISDQQRGWVKMLQAIQKNINDFFARP